MNRNLSHTFFSCVFVLVLSLFSITAQAGEPRLLGTYGDWDAYVFIDQGQKVCYMASKPQKSEGNYTRRGEVYALVTHRPADKTKNVFSYITGYTYKSGHDATVTANGKKFVLFTEDDTAWTSDASTDEALVKAIRSGSKMVVRGTSTRGTDTKDTFSLKGSSKAYARISKECGY